MRIRIRDLTRDNLHGIWLFVFAILMVLALTAGCSVASDAPPEEGHPSTSTQLEQHAEESSKVVIVGDEKVEVLDLDTQQLSTMPFEPLHWSEIDLTSDRGISSTGWLAARVLGPAGEPEQLNIQIVNTNDGTSLPLIPLLSAYLADTFSDGKPSSLGDEVRNMLLGGWNAPCWSPDGSKLAFTGARKGESSDVYVYDMQTEAVTRLSIESGQANVIGWSPDSSRIVYTIASDVEQYRYEATRLATVDVESGDIKHIRFDPGWNGVRIFGWPTDSSFLFSYYDLSNSTFQMLQLANIETGETFLLHYWQVDGAAVAPFSGTYAIVLNDDPDWGSGVFLGSLDGSMFEPVVDWGINERWHDLDWDESEGRYVVGSAAGALLFDSAQQQLDAFWDEECPPSPSPDGAWILFGACEGAGDLGGLMLYQRWDAPAKTLTEEIVINQIWRSDASQVIYLTLDGNLYVQPIPTGEPRLIWSGEALHIEVIQPSSERAVVKATQQAAPTSTYWPTKTPTQTPTRAPTATPEAPERLPGLRPGEPLLFDQLYMIDAKVGWGVTGRKTDYDLRRTYHLLRTEDGGDTWWEVTPPEWVEPSEADSLHLYGAFLDDQHAWVIPHSGNVFKAMYVWRTTDGGQTWSAARLRTRSSPVNAGPKLHFADKQRGWLFLVYFLGAGSYDVDIFRTDDGGVTWESVLLPSYPFSIVRELDFIDHRTGWLVSGHGAGFVPAFYLETTNDGGLNWTEVTLESGLKPSPLEGFCDIQDLHITSYSHGEVTRRCEVYREETIEWRYYLGTTEDAGQTWAYVEIPGKPYRLNESYRWAITSSPPSPDPVLEPTMIYRSSDGGRSWQQLSQVDWTGDLYFSTYRHGWALVEGQLFRTLDGGTNWESVDPWLVEPAEPSVDATDWVRLVASSDPINASSVAKLELLAEYDVDEPVSLAINDRALYVGTSRGRVAVWPLARIFPRTLPELRISDGWIYDLDTSFDLPGFWSASEDGHAYRYGDTFFDVLQRVPATQAELSGVAFSSAGVLIAGSEGSIDLWDWSADTSWDWVLKLELDGHHGWVWDVDASPDDKSYASVGADRTVRLWNAADGSSVGILLGHSSTVTKVRFSPDSQTLASASRDGSVRIWDVESAEQMLLLEGHIDWVLDLAYSPDGSLLASVSADGEVVLWNAISGELLGRWQAHYGAARGIVFSPNGSLLITAGGDDQVKLWGIEP